MKSEYDIFVNLCLIVIISMYYILTIPFVSGIFSFLTMLGVFYVINYHACEIYDTFQEIINEQPKNI